MITTTSLPYSKLARAKPGVMNGNGRDIIHAKIGMKIVVLRKKNFRGIRDAAQKIRAVTKTIRSGAIVLTATADNTSAAIEKSLTLGSICCRTP